MRCSCDWTCSWAAFCSLIACAACSFNKRFFLEISSVPLCSMFASWSRASLSSASLWRSMTSEWSALASLCNAWCCAAISWLARVVGSTPCCTTATWAVRWSTLLKLMVFNWLMSIHANPKHLACLCVDHFGMGQSHLPSKLMSPSLVAAPEWITISSGCCRTLLVPSAAVAVPPGAGSAGGVDMANVQGGMRNSVETKQISNRLAIRLITCRNKL